MSGISGILARIGEPGAAVDRETQQRADGLFAGLPAASTNSSASNGAATFQNVSLASAGDPAPERERQRVER